MTSGRMAVEEVVVGWSTTDPAELNAMVPPPPPPLPPTNMLDAEQSIRRKRRRSMVHMTCRFIEGVEIDAQ